MYLLCTVHSTLVKFVRTVEMKDRFEIILYICNMFEHKIKCPLKYVYIYTSNRQNYVGLSMNIDHDDNIIDTILIQ